MIAKLGASVKVRVYPSARHRDTGIGWTDMQAVIISAGPPGVVADWARTVQPPGKWLLVRKAKNQGGHDWEAIEGDQGKFG